MDTLYHYCSNFVFHSIVSNNSIWLSSLSHSNDSEEGKFASNYIRYAFRQNKLLNPTVLYELDARLEAAETNANGFGFCLSKKDDLLSQWRGYADDGQGMSIGFSKEYLKRITKHESDKFSLSLCEIKYYDRKNVEPVNPYIPEIITHIQNGAFNPVIRDSKNRVTSPEAKRLQEIKFEFNRCIHEMGYYQYRIKSEAFREESEWRLLAKPEYKGMAPAINEGLLSCKFRSTKKKFIPYIEIVLKDYGINPINEVIIGPKNETTEDLIHLLLHNSEYKDVKVRKSEASYR